MRPEGTIYGQEGMMYEARRNDVEAQRDDLPIQNYLTTLCSNGIVLAQPRYVYRVEGGPISRRKRRQIISFKKCNIS